MAAGPFDLTGRIALVTGGGSGLGLAIAEGLANAGARVVVNGRNRAKLDAAVQRLAGAGHAASACAFDVADEAAVAAGVAEIERLPIAFGNTTGFALANMSIYLLMAVTLVWRPLGIFGKAR